MPSASRIDAFSGSSRFAFSSETVACAAIPLRSRLLPSRKCRYAALISEGGHFRRLREQLFDRVEDRRRDPGLRRLLDRTLGCAGEQHDLVVDRIEADAGLAHVVE